MGQFKDRPKFLSDKNLDKLFEISMFANMETEAQSKYLDEMMWEIDQRAVRKYARMKGEAEGRTKGRAEVALAMKKRKMDIKIISELTGLTPEQIAEL